MDKRNLPKNTNNPCV